MSLVFDEYGKPFIIIRDQGSQKRLTGLDAQKVWLAHFPPPSLRAAVSHSCGAERGKHSEDVAGPTWHGQNAGVE